MPLRALFIGALQGIVGTGLLIALEPFRHSALSFAPSGACENAGGRRHPSSLRSEWKPRGLLIRAAENTYCGEAVSRVSAHVLGGDNFVRITYASPGDGPPAACLCGYTTHVLLADMERRPYRVRRVGWAYP
jgi:hypothetical protein